MIQTWLTGRLLQRAAVFGAVLALSVPLTHTADARMSRQGHNVRSSTLSSASHSKITRSHGRVMESSAYATNRRYAGRYTVARFGVSGGRLQCVPFARKNSGIALVGNAHTWWGSAAGVYERGARPEVGSVLSFRSNGRMRLGHVAVVSSVVDGRTLGIDHANWSGPAAGPGGITHNMTVVDVSEGNDWSAVRASVGDGRFGNVYPTNGFIYDRPDRGVMLANTGAHTPAPTLDAAPRDLRAPAERIVASLGNTTDEEVAEAPDDRAPRVRHASRRPSATAQNAWSHGRSRTPAVTMVGLRTRAPMAAATSRNRLQVAAPTQRDATPISTKRGKNRT